MRKLTEPELTAMKRMIDSVEADMRTRALADLRSSLVERETKDGSLWQIVIPGYQRPPYTGQRKIGRSGQIIDSDGSKLDVTLYADENDRVLLFEILKWGDDPIFGADWNSFQLTS